MQSNNNGVEEIIEDNAQRGDNSILNVEQLQTIGRYLDYYQKLQKENNKLQVPVFDTTQSNEGLNYVINSTALPNDETLKSKEFKRLSRLRDDHGRTLVHYAAMFYSFDELIELLEIAPIIFQDRDNDGNSFSHYFAFNPIVKDLTLEQLTQLRLNIYATNDHGDTTQNIASKMDLANFRHTSLKLKSLTLLFSEEYFEDIKNGAMECVKGYDLFSFSHLINDNGDTALHVTLKTLYEKVKALKTNEEKTKLINQYKELVKLLLNTGADVNQKDTEGNTALHLASQIIEPLSGDQSLKDTLVGILLKAGADFRIVNNDKHTPAQWADKFKFGNKQAVAQINMKQVRYQQKYGVENEQFHKWDVEHMWLETLARKSIVDVVGEFPNAKLEEIKNQIPYFAQLVLTSIEKELVSFDDYYYKAAKYPELNKVNEAHDIAQHFVLEKITPNIHLNLMIAIVGQAIKDLKIAIIKEGAEPKQIQRTQLPMFAHIKKRMLKAAITEDQLRDETQVAEAKITVNTAN